MGVSPGQERSREGPPVQLAGRPGPPWLSAQAAEGGVGWDAAGWALGAAAQAVGRGFLPALCRVVERGLNKGTSGALLGLGGSWRKKNSMQGPLFGV